MSNHKGQPTEFTNKRIALNFDFVRTALVSYKEMYSRNSYRIDADKIWLVSLQMRTLLTMLILEEFLKTDKKLSDYTYKFKVKSESFRYYLTTFLVPEYTLEQMLLICDIVGLNITDIKKRVISDILTNLGEQRNKSEYEKFNKLYSGN